MTAIDWTSEVIQHPSSPDEIAEYIAIASSTGQRVRARGSGHSVPEAIWSKASPGQEEVRLYLDKMCTVQVDRNSKRAVVGAGCHLGFDPLDIASASTEENGLFPQLHAMDLAVTDMGGIIHQTVGGFLSSGSSGGSVKHSVYDGVVGAKLVDGTGKVHEFVRDSDPDNPFFALFPSMGLLGVIYEVTVQCVRSYHVIGREEVQDEANGDVDLFGRGANDLETFLREIDHARVMWWPQKGVRKAVVWRGKKMTESDYNHKTGPPHDFKRTPYILLDPVLGSQHFTQQLASLVFTKYGRLNPPPPKSWIGRLKDRWLSWQYPTVVNAFLDAVGDEGAEVFWDDWWRALPMDNGADDELLPTEFTELWIPLTRTPEVMNDLRAYFEQGLSATGTYACEIYAAKANEFWMSPSYQEDMLRVDMFWFGKNEGDPARDFYPPFWRLLDKYRPRYHWGKHMPTNPVAVHERYPRWRDFNAFRKQMDPANVFLTPYWAERLGLTP